jgi:ubiquinone/menaquinone biosynthesis C-methylase UbiE
MRLEIAKKLIEEGIEQTDGRQIWVDLGAGNGLFTYALSTLISDVSEIYSVDTDVQSLNAINIRKPVTLNKIQADFEKENWGPDSVNGVLMANALHYVKDKERLLKSIAERLLPGGRLIIVEYEMDKANNWVPYPVGFDRLGELVFRTDYKSIRKLSEVPSVYEHRMIYSVLVRS